AGAPSAAVPAGGSGTSPGGPGLAAAGELQGPAGAAEQPIVPPAATATPGPGSGTSESGPEPSGAAGSEARGGNGRGAGAPAAAAGGAARALPIDELRRLGGEIETGSGKLRSLYADFLVRKAKGGKPLAGSDGKLADQWKELQHAAESFGAPFQTGFWARARSRLGRFGHSEDESAQITRLARDLAGSGARADALVAQVKPPAAVRQLWHRVRRQVRRVAEICGV
ncbi:MAG: hypothetical protein JOZ15_00100, partial [Acidobacteria bacterium]|nr:hypothetical protein [Acidobacteriota bacterium]